MPPSQPKLIYLTRRHPRLSAVEFTPRWRQHGALGMSLPRWRNIARYVHCDVLRPAVAAPALDPGYDGIGLIWHRSPEARRAHLEDTSSRAAMERDEAATFAAPIAKHCLVACETVLRQPGSSDGVKLTVFEWASPVNPGANAADAYAALALHGIDCRGHVVDTPLPPESGSWGLDCSRIQEWWFDDERTALRAAPILKSTLSAPRTVVVLTNEVLLYAA